MNLPVQGWQYCNGILETPSNFNRQVFKLTVATTSASVRKHKRQQRRNLSPVQQDQHAIQIAANITRLSEYKRSKHIACYLANDGEIIPDNIIEHGWKRNKTVYLPVLSPVQNRLYFAPYTKTCHLITNRFNIIEPDVSPSQWRQAWQLDLLLLPLVAFDEAGNRIGMGGGFYDRTLAYRNRMHTWKKPHLIGLAHELQKSTQLLHQHWDIPLDMIATEERIYRCK